MTTLIEYDRLRPGEEASALELVLAVFDEHVAPGFSPQGIAEFRKFANGEALESRLREGSVLFVGRRGGDLVGVVEVLGGRHLAMLFVDSARQGEGVGKELVRLAVAHCLAGDARELTVNASPGSTGFYRLMGFEALSEEEEANGIRFVPMKRALKGE